MFPEEGFAEDYLYLVEEFFTEEQKEEWLQFDPFCKKLEMLYRIKVPPDVIGDIWMYWDEFRGEWESETRALIDAEIYEDYSSVYG